MKKIFMLLILGLAVVCAFVWLVNYISTGTITVTASDHNSSIMLQRSSQGKPFVKVGLNSLTTTVGHGQYVAIVKKGSQTGVQIINFTRGHKRLQYSVSLAGLRTVEPVTFQGATDVIADSQLVYLDVTTNGLFRIDSQNNSGPLSSSQLLQSVKWASSSFGVGKAADGHLYSITNGFVGSLKVPFSYNGAAVNFDVARNKKIYLSYGADVYGGGENTGFKKIYTATSTKPLLAAGVNQVAVTDGAASNDANTPDRLLIVISSSGKVNRKVDEGGIRRLVWSPDGRYLASINESYVGIYDSSLLRVATVPISSFVRYVEGFTGYGGWASNNKLVYASNDELWSYDLTSQKVELLATLPLDNSITGLAISSDKTYAYATTVDSNNNYAIRRVGLNDQKVTPLLREVGRILPMTLNDCLANLVNFAQPPVILVGPFPGSNLGPQACLQEAETNLQQNGLDPGKFQYKLTGATE